MTWRLDGRPLRRVLVTRLRYLGDVVMATVVADVLKAGDPELEVGFLCEAAFGTVLIDHPAVDRIHLLGVTRSGHDAAARSAEAMVPAGAGTLATVRALRAVHYDLAVDLLFNPRSAWLLRLAGIRARIGGTRSARRRLYTHNVPNEEITDAGGVLAARAPGVLAHHLGRLTPLVHGDAGTPFLAWLAGATPPVRLRPRLARRRMGAEARRVLAGAGIDPAAPYLVAAPGATWPAKAWPVEHWRSLLADLQKGPSPPAVVLVPPPGGAPWADLPGALPPLSLPTALDVVAGARGLVAVDGGVTHAAVALAVPTLALFGPTDPALWFPYDDAPTRRVLATRPDCHPCDRHECPPQEFVCLPQLAPEIVAAQVELMIAAAPEAGT